MDIKQIYREQTELDVYTTVSLDDGASFSNEYVKWLEAKLMYSDEQLILEAILSDKQLQSLHAERVKIYSLAPRTIVMKENKIIAEFMSGDFKVNAHYGINIDFLKDNITAKQLENDLRYDKSWDWLMPVVDKIKILVMEDDSDELYNSEEWDNITHTLVQIEIKSVYQAVVEFINEYNETKQI